MVPFLLATAPDAKGCRLHEALLKLKRPHEYVVYPKEGHGFSDPVHSTDFLTRVGAFLDKNNPAGP
jgi:dipeptidyl aminopeptidase/acylaminoacyl peptidase